MKYLWSIIFLVAFYFCTYSACEGSKGAENIIAVWAWIGIFLSILFSFSLLFPDDKIKELSVPRIGFLKITNLLYLPAGIYLIYSDFILYGTLEVVSILLMYVSINNILNIKGDKK